MTIESTEIPELVTINPIWLWMFRHAIEDLNWGKRPIDQHTLAITIYELAGKIEDLEMRKQIQASAAKHLLNTAQYIARNSYSGD
ncbi:hypothetical protein SAMN05216411_11554 [Nitrosospira multiformis]|nr:hypothetical protein SAMN05216411_11554 [Nitrosospira multiformis]